MLRLIHSIPDSCPACGSENLGGREMLLYEESNTVLCNQCGVIMVLQDGYEEEANVEVPASFVSCPHCCTINEVRVAGGEEWCGGCGLDPSREGYPPEELAFLWKKDSGIQQTMERGVPKRAMTKLYRFLTSSCGPHCSYATACPQSTGNFATCFREEGDTGFDSGGRSLLHVGEGEVGRGKRKGSHKARKQEKERIRREKERAVLACAGAGWYEKRYRNEIEDPQEPSHTGGGPGT